MMKKGQVVKVVNEKARSTMQFVEALFGDGKTLSLQGECLAVHPTVEEYKTISPIFAEIAELRTLNGEYDAMAEGLSQTVIYYDEGAGRPFAVDIEDVAGIAENFDDEDWSDWDDFEDYDNDSDFYDYEDYYDDIADIDVVEIGDEVKAIGLGEMFMKMSGGSGQGIVVHTKYDEPSPEIRKHFAINDIPTEFYDKGIMYKDSKNGEILWLADDDFEIVE